MSEIKIDKGRFKDVMGRYITQSLFFEHNNSPLAVYTWKDADHEYEGKTYYSLRRLYLECNDPTEYVFATKYLWGWDHWQRLLENKLIREQVDKWRDELEVKLRAEAVRHIIEQGADSFTAAKWAADGNWNTKTTTRKTKAEIKREKDMRERAVKGYEDDSNRILHLIPKKEAK